MSTIYHNPRCSTSRNALARLQESGQQPEIIEYLKTPPSSEQLRRLIVAAGITPRQAIRAKESVYADLGLAAATTTDEQLIDAMVAHPILIERPFVVTEKGTRLCRPLERVEEIL